MNQLGLILVLSLVCAGCSMPVTMGLYKELDNLGRYELVIENQTDHKIYVEHGEYWWSGPVIFTLKGALLPLTLALDSLIGVCIETPALITRAFFNDAGNEKKVGASYVIERKAKS